MLQVAPYITFNGNCREAMEFYRHCFGGTLQVKMLRDTSAGPSLLGTLGEIVLEAELTSPDFQLLASDLVEEEGLATGNKVALQCRGTHQEEINGIFEKLARGGKITQPYDFAQKDSLATLTDRYGIHWIFSFAG